MRTRQFLDEVLVPLRRIVPSEQPHRRALGVQDRDRYSLYAASIIGAALEEGCRKLYAEDLQAGPRMEELMIVDPFRGGQ